jgi:hypothetical protein
MPKFLGNVLFYLVTLNPEIDSNSSDIKKIIILTPSKLYLGTGHYLWRGGGVAPKRKGLGKQNFE